MTEQGFYRGEGGIDPDTGKPWKAARIGSKNKAVIEAAVVAAYKAKGVAAPRNAPTARFPDGSIKTDKDALKNSGDPLLAELSGAGPLGTVVNTFLPLLESAVNGRVHTQYKNLLATGRISSSKPNLNNIPRGSVVEGVGVRECFVPSPGMHLLSTDYDCAELRSHAQVNYALFGRSAARDFFCADPKGDPHLGLAASIQGLSYEEAKARKAELKGLRQMCKAPNFGLPGGMGIARFIESARKGYGVTLTEAQAKQLKAQWHRRWPEMRRYFEYVTALTERQGYVKQWAPSWAGEHRVRGRNPQEANRWFSQVANTLFQGLTADGAKDALWRVTRACYVEESSPLYGSFPVGFLYDEVLTEVPEERSHEAGYEQARLMVEGMQRWTPDVPATVSPALMTSWQKNAEEVVVGGKLVPWFPTKSV